VLGKDADRRNSLSRVARLWTVRGEDAPDQVYVRLPEEMDITSAGTVVAAVRQIPADWPIVFDVRSLEFVDVAGAAEFVQALEEASEKGRSVVIRGPFTPAVARLLEVTDGLVDLVR
jgi:anti-anti-sigma factor